MGRRPNCLVDVAPGTVNVSTDRPVFVASGSERPPQKVMQTAVVGGLGDLTYRLDLSGFPGNGWAFSYFTEIEEFVEPETRKFKLFIPGLRQVRLLDDYCRPLGPMLTAVPAYERRRLDQARRRTVVAGSAVSTCARSFNISYLKVPSQFLIVYINSIPVERGEQWWHTSVTSSAMMGGESIVLSKGGSLDLRHLDDGSSTFGVLSISPWRQPVKVQRSRGAAWLEPSSLTFL
ncbi:hypothetical protein U9M48_032721 [Paspalum notatum var. saurae]|uniref:Malectin-like domain-containing protein n=1 Tax=Paspalum notatum var. saurae TaxID=547442 RepID=A0AAQ3U5X6_PASNO